VQVQWVLKNLSCVCVGMLEAGDPSDAGSASGGLVLSSM